MLVYAGDAATSNVEFCKLLANLPPVRELVGTCSDAKPGNHFEHSLLVFFEDGPIAGEDRFRCRSPSHQGWPLLADLPQVITRSHRDVVKRPGVPLIFQGACAQFAKVGLNCDEQIINAETC